MSLAHGTIFPSVGAASPAWDIELASLRAWPAPETSLLDGWELRFAAGFTKRANSVQPVGASLRDLDRKVAQCESWYGARRAPTVFRMTPFSDPELEPVLERRGYRVIDPVAVLHLRHPAAIAAKGSAVATHALDEWLTAYAAMSNLGGEPLAAMRGIITACRQEQLLGVVTDGTSLELRACGMAVRDGALVGLFDLVTDARHRRKGFGKALIAGLVGWGLSRGASAAYLQVLKSNTLAWSLYEKIGFEHSYDYWYRVRPQAG